MHAGPRPRRPAPPTPSPSVLPPPSVVPSPDGSPYREPDLREDWLPNDGASAMRDPASPLPVVRSPADGVPDPPSPEAPPPTLDARWPLLWFGVAFLLAIALGAYLSAAQG